MHFDGQAVEISKWNQENPYDVVLKKQVEWSNLDNEIDLDLKLFGRSTSDDKGPIVMFLNAIDLLQKNKKEILYLDYHIF